MEFTKEEMALINGWAWRNIDDVLSKSDAVIPSKYQIIEAFTRAEKRLRASKEVAARES